MAKRIQKSSGGGISIHAPAWGATRGSRTGGLPKTGFQFTPPRGGRQTIISPGFLVAEISIHAPAWGATRATALYLRVQADFNSRPRVRGDKAQKDVVYCYAIISIHAPA